MTKFGWLMVLIGCAHTPVPQVASWDLVGGRGIVTVPVDDGREEPEAGMLHAGTVLMRERCNPFYKSESHGLLMPPSLKASAPIEPKGSFARYYIVFSCPHPLRARVTEMQRSELLLSPDQPQEVKGQLVARDPRGFQGIGWGTAMDVVEDRLDDAGLDSKDEGASLTTRELVGAVSATIRRSFKNGGFALVEIFASPDDAPELLEATRKKYGIPDWHDDRWDVYEFASSRVLIARDVAREPRLRIESRELRGNQNVVIENAGP